MPELGYRAATPADLDVIHRELMAVIEESPHYNEIFKAHESARLTKGFLRALQDIDPTLYEAASIDGAGRWDTFKRSRRSSGYGKTRRGAGTGCEVTNLTSRECERRIRETQSVAHTSGSSGGRHRLATSSISGQSPFIRSGVTTSTSEKPASSSNPVIRSGVYIAKWSSPQ